MNFKTLPFVFGLVLVLSACQSSKEFLGFNRVDNDAFSVNTTPPLELPKDFNHLPLPAEDVSEVYYTDKNDAQKTAFEQFSQSVSFSGNETASAGEIEILEKTRAAEKDPFIRKKLAQEHKQDKENASVSLASKIIGGKEKEEVHALDPYEEKKRLEQRDE